ncbi:ribonuclease HII [Aestuariispira insulae]|uniref:Ribonuclease HII n=1 Tax=Aestuariispira insulae TaxID=1461337 RepID=A0A3D9HGJ6_9PROT|nr:ribonuclease HII [Aestuariispira insulae]RED48609.1 RNase HII [Aestuariispira insulae]
MPDFSLESQFDGPVAGIDEVGRGPWAGPVVTCAAILDPETFPIELAAQLDDSKKLTDKKREALFEPLCQHSIYCLGEASVTEIDQVNILAATMLAMRRAVDGLPQKPAVALVDGNRDPKLGIPTQTVVKGDGRSLSIAAASVIAKVARDRMMRTLAAEFPGYGWERNAGYGTKAHQEGLAQLGVTPHHRRSFAPIAHLLMD